MARTLRFGDRGPEVGRLQTLLNQRLRPSPQLGVDGVFGRRTAGAVRLYQAAVDLGIDGIAGPRTWAALETERPKSAGAERPVPVTSPDAPWMAIATREVGQREVPGRQRNPRIIAYHATTTLGASSDETPWCASFVNWCLLQAGIAGTDSAGAASWLRWGRTCGPRTGAITVIYNPELKNSGMSRTGNHVGFLVRSTSTHFVLLGGNQSDQVKVSRYPKSAWQLKGHRWPAP
ncbi:MAG: TIGR02594 family protein [Burkholderiales bacterium]|nr:MAG: TIGR02594 family protein [Burkholderiales bacterium]